MVMTENPRGECSRYKRNTTIRRSIKVEKDLKTALLGGRGAVSPFADISHKHVRVGTQKFSTSALRT